MPHSHRKQRLYVQIMAGFTALAIAAIVVTGCFCLFLFQRLAVRRHLSELDASMETVVRVARTYAEGGAAPDGYHVNEISKLTNAQVVYWNARTGLARESAGDSYTPASPSPADLALFRRVLAGGGISGVYSLDCLGGKVMLQGALVSDSSGEAAGVVLLARELSIIQRYASNFFLPLMAGAIFALILSCVSSWYFARLICRPIEHLESAAAHVRANTRDFENVSGPLEVENLGGALQDLAGQLNRSIDSLAAERSRLQQVVNGIGEGLIAVDASGRLIHHNEAALDLCGCDEDGLRAGTGEAGELMELLRRVIATPERRSTVWQLPDGRSVQATVRPIYDDGAERVSGAVALMLDVSESERLEQMRRDYIANISHELRTPLTGIRGMVEPLLDGVIDEEEEKQNSYRIIYQETVRLQKLIGDMLDMSRLQAGRIELDLQPIEIVSMLRAARQRVLSNASAKGVSLAVDCPEEDIWCQADEDRVMQVLIILLDNAIRFTPSGGVVTLFARTDGEWTAFGVRDTGCGIDPKDLPYIWERFFKADRSRSRDGGTGLGLSIARLAVELMEGRICAQSALGSGAQFTVRLRAQEAPKA